MADVLLDLRGWGHVYLCHSCVADLARLFDWTAPDERDATADLLAERAGRIVQLEDELEFERAHKTVPLQEAIDRIQARDGGMVELAPAGGKRASKG